MQFVFIAFQFSDHINNHLNHVIYLITLHFNPVVYFYYISILSLFIIAFKCHFYLITLHFNPVVYFYCI